MDLGGLRLAGVELRCRPSLWGRLGRVIFTVGMEHFRFEDHFRRLVGKLIRELQLGFIESPLKRCVLWSLEADSPIKKISIF